MTIEVEELRSVRVRAFVVLLLSVSIMFGLVSGFLFVPYTIVLCFLIVGVYESFSSRNGDLGTHLN